MVFSTTFRSSVELTARPTSPRAELLRARELLRRLHLLEQPRVLDGDHGLVGEGLDQLDLLVGERAGPRCDRRRSTPIGVPFSQHRHSQHACGCRPSSPMSRVSVILGSAQYVGDVNDRPVEHRAAGDARWSGSSGMRVDCRDARRAPAGCAVRRAE